MKEYYKLTKEEVFATLNTSEKGLNNKEALERLKNMEKTNYRQKK